MEKGELQVVIAYADILLEGDNLEYVAASYYGFYVLERILLLLKKEEGKRQQVLQRLKAQVPQMNKQMKQKWQEALQGK